MDITFIKLYFVQQPYNGKHISYNYIICSNFAMSCTQPIAIYRAAAMLLNTQSI